MTSNEKLRIMRRQWNPVVCAGCGEVILESDNLDEVEYVRTKRKTDIFFHRACMDKVWRKEKVET